MKSIKMVFYVLMGIFVVMLGWMVIPFPVGMRQGLFSFVVVLTLIFFLLGLVLVFLTIKRGVKGKLKRFLILTGGSAGGFLISVLLHNFLYGLAMMVGGVSWLYSLVEILHVAFFMTAIFVCPLGFLIGVVGSMVMFSKKKK